MCEVSNSIAVNADEPGSFPCWSCERIITEDDVSTEILTRDSGLQHVCVGCLDEYSGEGL